MTPPVSVVIPVFNGSRFLRRTIDSLRAQTIRDFPLICIDDASTDDSMAIAHTAGVPVLQNRERRGLAANWNRAIDVADTEYFVIAHQDDVYEPAYLETMLRVIEPRPRAFAVHCKVQTIDERGETTAHPAALFKERFWTSDDPMEREPRAEVSMLQRGNYVVAPTVLFRRSAVMRVGPFNERYAFVTDWEYWMRGALAGFTFPGVQERLVSFRRHEETATRAHERTMRRYEEELELLQWLDALRPGARAYAAIENTLLADFVERLASGDREGARTLALFAKRRVPRFAGSFRERVMRTALAGGTVAGRALRAAEYAYLRSHRASKA